MGRSVVGTLDPPRFDTDRTLPVSNGGRRHRVLAAALRRPDAFTRCRYDTATDRFLRRRRAVQALLQGPEAPPEPKLPRKAGFTDDLGFLKRWRNAVTFTSEPSFERHKIWQDWLRRQPPPSAGIAKLLLEFEQGRVRLVTTVGDREQQAGERQWFKSHEALLRLVLP